jgi:3-oxoacyl-[acyl-carrier protein] reductase
MLENKNAVIYGGGGAIGRATALAFAREGARVFLAGRRLSKLEAVAQEIIEEGGRAQVASVDALDEKAVDEHAAEVVWDGGSIDVSFNAVGINHVQGTPFVELSLEDYSHPITAYTRTNFITAKAAARHMVKRGSGVILTISTPGSRLPGVGATGFGVACAAIEALTRHLAGELGPSGIRVVCLRPDAIPEAVERRSHSAEVFRGPADRAGVSIESMLSQHASTGTLLKRLPTLADVANFAAFLASEGARAMTGSIANLTCGSLVD